MPKALDPFWEYGEPDCRTNRAYLTCKLCGTRMTRGVTQLKYHLARVTRHDVGICTISSPELIQKALEAIDEKDRKKEETERNKVERAGRSFGISSPDFDAESSVRSSTALPATASARSSFFVPRTGHGSQPSIKSLVKKKEKQEADRAMGRCLFWSDLPLNITKTNPFWQPMCDAIVVVGPGYKSATYEELQGPILQEEKQYINSRFAELKKTWEVTGCTVMSDGWTDRKGRTLLNFLVHCPIGITFIKSVDASEDIKDATTICELLERFLWEIGVKNVVQVITDNATNYVYSWRQDGKAIAKMVYSETFWRGLDEACSINEPIVKVLRLVDGEKPTMAYLYEAMDRTKEAIHSYYADKDSVGLDRHMML
eukprot:PITA_35915